MAHEMKGWVHVRVKCPDCGESIYTSWPPEDRSDHLVKHGTCSTFRLGRKEALLQQLANAVEQEEREKLKRGPGVRPLERSPYRRGPQMRANPEGGGDGEEGKPKGPKDRWKLYYGRRGPGPGKDELGRDRGDEEE